MARLDVSENGLAPAQQNWRQDDTDLVYETLLEAGRRKSIAAHPQQSVTSHRIANRNGHCRLSADTLERIGDIRVRIAGGIYRGGGSTNHHAGSRYRTRP